MSWAQARGYRAAASIGRSGTHPAAHVSVAAAIPCYH